jgi:hypothetical protein
MGGRFLAQTVTPRRSALCHAAGQSGFIARCVRVYSGRRVWGVHSEGSDAALRHLRRSPTVSGKVLEIEVQPTGGIFSQQERLPINVASRCALLRQQ